MKKGGKSKADTESSLTGTRLECIRRAEWDFDSEAPGFRCPDDELEECKVYECARRSTFWPELTSIIGTIPSESIFYDDNDTFYRRIADFLASFSEFPKKPWLLIDPIKRAATLAKLRTLKPKDRPPLLEDTDQYPGSTKFDFDVEQWSLGPVWPDGSTILANHRLTVPRLADPLHTFRICWEHSDTELKCAFSEWLDANRPTEYLVFSGGAGKHALRQDALRSALRAIGAWTLKKDSHLSIEKLIKETRELLKDKGGAKASLYTSRKRWKGAEKLAMASIRAVEPASMMLEFTQGLPQPSKTLKATPLGKGLYGGEVFSFSLPRSS